MRRNANAAQLCVSSVLRTVSAATSSLTTIAAADIGLFGPAGGDLTVNEGGHQYGQADNHIIIRIHRFCRRGRFWRGGTTGAGAALPVSLSALYAFTTGFYRQIATSSSKLGSSSRAINVFDQHRDVDAAITSWRCLSTTMRLAKH